MKDYYQVLEVQHNASHDEIKDQYLFLIQAWHPDKFSNPSLKAKAEEKTKEINEAYNVLKNPTKREKYDKEQSTQPSWFEEDEKQRQRARADEERRHAEYERQRREQAEAVKRQAEYKRQRRERAGRQAARARRNAMIRNVAIGVAALAAIVIIILIITSQKPGSASQPSAGGPTPALVGTKTYASAPPTLIDQSKQYFATVKMATGGEFVLQLYPDKAPVAVNSFVFLARQGYFNGVTFHRVLPGFMAQGGDPAGTGNGGPGYHFANEANDLTFDKAGVVAMANTGQPDSNGSQFFITFAPQAYLNGGYTIFGQVTSGMDVVLAIKLRDPDKSPTYPGDAMESVTINEK